MHSVAFLDSLEELINETLEYSGDMLNVALLNGHIQPLFPFVFQALEKQLADMDATMSGV